jgi:hypothetical protein
MMNINFPVAGVFLTLFFSFGGVCASGQEMRQSDTVRWEQGGLRLSDMRPVSVKKGATYRVYPVPDTISVPDYSPDKTDTANTQRVVGNYSDYIRLLTEEELDPVIQFVPSVGYELIYRKEGNLKYTEKVSYTYFLKSKTTYDINRCDSWSLRYNQVQFDIYEAYRRWHESLMSSGQKNLARSLYFEDLEKAALRTFRMESSYGRDTSVIKQYEQRYAAMLDTLLPHPEFRVYTDHDDNGFSFSAGVSYEHFIDGVPGELITTPGLFVGLGYSYRNICLQLELGGLDAGHLSQRDFWHDPKLDYDWIENGKTTSARVSANLGYKVIDRPYLTVTPFIGVGLMSISQKTDIIDPVLKDRFQNSDLNGTRTQAGFNIDWKIVRNMRPTTSRYISKSEHNLTYEEQKVSLRLYGIRTQFPVIGPAYSVSIGVGYQFDSWNIYR